MNIRIVPINRSIVKHFPFSIYCRSKCPSLVWFITLSHVSTIWVKQREKGESWKEISSLGLSRFDVKERSMSFCESFNFLLLVIRGQCIFIINLYLLRYVPLLCVTCSSCQLIVSVFANFAIRLCRAYDRRDAVFYISHLLIQRFVTV